MKHLKLTETTSEFESLRGGGNLVEPWVVLIKDDMTVHMPYVSNDIPSNEIWYTTTDGQIFEMMDVETMGMQYEYTLVSNTYENGLGKMVFDQDVEYIGIQGETEEDMKVYPVFLQMEENTLKTIQLPDSLTSIGGSAFQTCSSLETITIPDSVTSIGSGTFVGCSSLTSIIIPDSVTSIGENAFVDCSITSVIIPDSVTSIGDYAFYGSTSLTSVTIGNSVTSIGNNVFDYCTRLTNVIIGNSVTSIDSSAFYGCSSLTSIIIPDSVTSIGKNAFDGCTSLTSVTIPDSVTSIGDSAFRGCSSLTSITYNGTVEQWNAITKGTDWHYKVPSTTVVTCTDGTVALN